MASFWDELLRAETKRETLDREDALRIQRDTAVASFRPVPPRWLTSPAMEHAFVHVSPVVATFANLLVTHEKGMHPDRLRLIFGVASRFSGTAVTAPSDLRVEVRRLAMLIEASVRAFLPSIYEGDGEAPSAQALRALPPIRELGHVVIYARAVLLFLEAELRNVTNRPPLAHLFFTSAVRDVAALMARFDRVVSTVRKAQRIDPRSMSAVVWYAFSTYAAARRRPAVEEPLDEYAAALAHNLIAPPADLLLDLNLPKVTPERA